jgi:hypothetical protein
MDKVKVNPYCKIVVSEKRTPKEKEEVRKKAYLDRESVVRVGVSTYFDLFLGKDDAEDIMEEIIEKNPTLPKEQVIEKAKDKLSWMASGYDIVGKSEQSIHYGVADYEIEFNNIVLDEIYEEILERKRSEIE